MAKHVEILIAYDNSLREFHSDIDVKSYILTLFGYVNLNKRFYVEKKNFFFIQ